MSLFSIFSFTRENSKSARGKSLDPRHPFSRISVNLDRLPLPPFLHPLSLFLFFFSRAVFTLRVNDDAPLTLLPRDLDLEDGACVLRIRFTKIRSVDRVELFTWPRTGGKRDAVDTSFQGYGRVVHPFLWQLSSCGERAGLISWRYWIALILS